MFDILQQETGKSGELPAGKTQLHKKIFLEAYARIGNVSEAAEVAGIRRGIVHDTWLRHDEEFQEAYKEAQQIYLDKLTKEADRRAIEGILKPVYQGGKLVGEIREYDSTLLMFRMKKLDPSYRENAQLNVNVDIQEIKTIEVRLPVGTVAAPERVIEVSRAGEGERLAGPGEITSEIETRIDREAAEPGEQTGQLRAESKARQPRETIEEGRKLEELAGEIEQSREPETETGRKEGNPELREGTRQDPPNPGEEATQPEGLGGDGGRGEGTAKERGERGE